MKREYYCLKELIKGNWETNKIQFLREKTDTDITRIDLKIPLSLCPESSVQTWTLLVFGQQKLLASPLWNITHQINQRFIPWAKMLWIQYRRWLTSPSCLLETACPVAAGSDSQAQVGSPLAGRLAFLSSHSAPSLPPGGLVSQGFEHFWDITDQWLVSTKTGFSFCYIKVCLWRTITLTLEWRAAHPPSLTPSFSFWTVCSSVSCVCGVCAFRPTRFRFLPKRPETTRENWGMSQRNGMFVFSCLGVLI